MIMKKSPNKKSKDEDYDAPLFDRAVLEIWCKKHPTLLSDQKALVRWARKHPLEFLNVTVSFELAKRRS